MPYRIIVFAFQHFRAADLGLTANAVYIAKSRVLRALRDELCEDE